MSFSIFDRGDGHFRLVRGDREIGWVEDRVIGFRGFADADDARAAATTAYNALAGWTARQIRTEPAPRRMTRLSVRREGAVAWLTLDGVRIGRLRRFGADDDARGAPDFGFEIHLPARVADGLTLNAAQVIDRALQFRVLALPDSRVPRHALATRHGARTDPDLTTTDHGPPAA
jgi:hypothetical protein